VLNRFGKHVHIALKCFVVIMKVPEMEVHKISRYFKNENNNKMVGKRQFDEIINI